MGPVQGSPTIIIGPVGTKRVVNGLREMLALDEPYRLDHHADLRSGSGMQLDVREVSPGDTFSIGDVRIIVGKTDHRPVAPTVGYRFEAEDKVATLAGDTVPRAELDALCADADIYVQTVLWPDLMEVMKQFVPAQAPRLHEILDCHSSLQDAGQTAARAGVGPGNSWSQAPRGSRLGLGRCRRQGRSCRTGRCSRKVFLLRCRLSRHARRQLWRLYGHMAGRLPR
jgi:hypothetical protein